MNGFLNAVRKIGIVILFVVVVVCLLSAVSAYVRLKPPASVVTVPFRMILQMTIKLQIPLIFICVAGVGVGIVSTIRRQECVRKWLGVLLVLSLVVLVAESVTAVRLMNVSTDKSIIEYDCVGAGSGRDINNLMLDKKLSETLEKDLDVCQCNIYRNADSPYKENCVIYLNYGGWAVQDESYGIQIRGFCEKEGYTYIQFATEPSPTDSVSIISGIINQKLNMLMNNETFINALGTNGQQAEKMSHVFLCGGSAGGHLAMLCGLVGDDNELGIEPVCADGIFALYPCADPAYTYDYYVDNPAHTPIGKFGDWIYCSLYNGSTGTLAGETRKLDERLFGIRNEAGSLYESTAIRNFIDRKIPVLIVQGDKDTMIPVEGARSLYSEMSAKGCPAAYLELPGAEHVFDLTPSMAWDRCEREITGFIRCIINNQ